MAAYRERYPLPLIERPGSPRALRYREIDGDQVHAHLPALEALHQAVHAVARARNGDARVPLRHRVDGGETDVYPGCRLSLGRWKAGAVQAFLDRVLQWRVFRRVFGRLRTIAPEAGRLVLMRGDRSLHSERSVTGEAERINVVMTFDLAGAEHPQARALDHDGEGVRCAGRTNLGSQKSHGCEVVHGHQVVSAGGRRAVGSRIPRYHHEPVTGSSNALPGCCGRTCQRVRWRSSEVHGSLDGSWLPGGP